MQALEVPGPTVGFYYLPVSVRVFIIMCALLDPEVGAGAGTGSEFRPALPGLIRS